MVQTIILLLETTYVLAIKNLLGGTLAFVVSCLSILSCPCYLALGVVITEFTSNMIRLSTEL